MKDVQCYELFGGIALKNHAFSYFIFIYQSAKSHMCIWICVHVDVCTSMHADIKAV